VRVLEGKRVLVTGAGQGLGKAYAEAMAREGARVAVNDINAESAEQAAAGIEAGGGQAFALPGDVSDFAGAGRLVRQCIEALGGLDVLVNNAGVYAVAPLWETTERDFDRIVAVNLKGTFNMARHAVEHMKAGRSGCIINVTSGAASGLLDRSVYGASKGGVLSFTIAWALELAPHGVRVNAVSPMATTAMSAVHKGTSRAKWPPENVAPLVVFLASDDAAYVTGQAVRLEGNALSLVTHPRPVRPATVSEGWSVAAFRDYFKHALGSNLEPVGLLAKGYEYYEGLG
jgi:NAD(P)-dependent dehydrogenase (short-subunit alcohol dehydrogenase family)